MQHVIRHAESWSCASSLEHVTMSHQQDPGFHMHLRSLRSLRDQQFSDVKLYATGDANGLTIPKLLTSQPSQGNNHPEKLTISGLTIEELLLYTIGFVHGSHCNVL